MGAAKKFRDHYPKEGPREGHSAKTSKNNTADKAMIDQYVSKIEDLLKDDPKAQKKAADIISALINQKKSN